ncbi:hypothetical protein PsYK624_021810 [Phanerochaete sordida]|uniref:BZIP domain-containing protein n=1 Tax=Phanerochaete sordida TaxID=48140 RepID=A0A9P3G0S5_9APHY|nr:hypothetical protein PsYK624_021810 [Phanerochaete sordida]
MPDATSPTSTTSKAGSDEGAPLDAAERKKKNADAQAAFRARRANYIATLEETVTNLEAVVLQLQDSNRQLKDEVGDLRNHNIQLHNERRDREKFWKALWQARSTGMPPDPLDDSVLPSYAQIHHSSPIHTPNRLASVSPTHYQDPRLQYPSDASAPLPPQYQPNTATEYMQQRSPALGFVQGNPAAGPSRAPSVDPHRMNGYGAYPQYASEGSSPEDGWPQHGIPTPVTDRSHIDHSPSPTYVESPSLTSAELAYSSHQVVGEEHKVGHNGVQQSPYMYATSRSTSPSSTPTSTSSLSLAAAPYQFTFPEGSAIQDRPEFAQRRPNVNYMNLRSPPELTLHGGTADIPIAGSVGDAMRFRMGMVRAHTQPSLVSAAYAPHGSHHESDEDDATSQAGSVRARPRRSTAPSAARASQSPPGSPPTISGTLAVIKAQAFGAYRRSRPRTRRGSGDAAKLSVEALSARGIPVAGGGGPASKRQRLQNGMSHDTLSSPP